MARPELVGLLDNIQPGHLSLPGVGFQERAQDAHGGGLASPVRAEQAGDTALLVN